MVATAKRLIIIGAGPKAVAIAAKGRVLARLGFTVPDVVVIDKSAIAANWLGSFGYTDGEQLLGTPPDKDVGFPYASTTWNQADKTVANEVNHLMQQYSWQSYLVDRGLYAGWVDRGRPQPKHRVFGDYLRWVANEVGMKIVKTSVCNVAVHDERWVLSCVKAEESVSTSIVGDALVVTGPGTPIHIEGYVNDHPLVMDGRTFWSGLAQFRNLRHRVSVAVVGTGETAGSVVLALLRELPIGSTIDVVSPHGVHYTRGESFEENRLFSTPEPEWSTLNAEHRREFTKRTDRGVFSVNAKRALDSAENLHTIPGTAIRMDAREAEVVLAIKYDNRVDDHVYDFVVVAIGFKALWFLDLFDNVAQKLFKSSVKLGEPGSVEGSIEHDLGVKGLEPRLHLPMLAAMAQGPGFPNLSCLGLVSDRVLEPYVVADSGTS